MKYLSYNFSQKDLLKPILNDYHQEAGIGGQALVTLREDMKQYEGGVPKSRNRESIDESWLASPTTFRVVPLIPCTFLTSCLSLLLQLLFDQCHYMELRVKSLQGKKCSMSTHRQDQRFRCVVSVHGTLCFKTEAGLLGKGGGDLLCLLQQADASCCHVFAALGEREL